MEDYVLRRDNLPAFLQFLMRQGPVSAPVAVGEKSFAFQEVTSPEEVALNALPTILPPKKYFLPQYETLGEFDSREGQQIQGVAELEERILFAVRTCDLAGIGCLNAALSRRPRDLNFLLRKERITLIGLECNSYCDEYASCALMGNHLADGGCDLMFTDLGELFYAMAYTQRGHELVSSAGLFSPADDPVRKERDALSKNKEAVFHPEVDVNRDDIPALFAEGFDNPVWQEIGRRCLSCGNCTNVCPTCYCFDVADIPNLDLVTGRRVRVWDSCQNEPFAKVAGGESFRALRQDRKRHRFNRKFSYPVAKFGRFFCTGCGRCSRTCMAKIDLKETISCLAKGGGE